MFKRRSKNLLPASCNSSFGYRSPDINLNILRRGGESVSVLLKADVLSHCSEGKSCATGYIPEFKRFYAKKIGQIRYILFISFMMFGYLSRYNHFFLNYFYLKKSEIFQ